MGTSVRLFIDGRMHHRITSGTLLGDARGAIAGLLEDEGLVSSATHHLPAIDADFTEIFRQDEAGLGPEIVSELIVFLEMAHAAARDASPAISRATVTCTASAGWVAVARTDLPGSVTRMTASTLLRADADARLAGVRCRGRYGWACHKHPVEIQSLALHARTVGEAAGDQAVRLLGSRAVRPDPGTVIFGPEASGVLVHEVVGHPLEADVIHARQSRLGDMLGNSVTSRMVTVVDDGGADGVWGCEPSDDEGTPVSRTVLVDDGTVAGCLTDRAHARDLGVAATGNSRRSSYLSPPQPRMRNITLCAGPAGDVSDMIGSTRRGLLVQAVDGGDADPASGKFSFRIREGYIIDHGKLGLCVTGLTVVGDSLDALAGIDAVGSDVVTTQSLCRKKGQLIGVTHSAPSVRLNGLRILNGPAE